MDKDSRPLLVRMAPGIPVRAVCQVHRVSDSLVKAGQVMTGPANTETVVPLCKQGSLQ